MRAPGTGTPLVGPRDLLRRYHQAMVDRDADALADLYAAEAVHELPFLFPGMPTQYDGREQIRAGYRSAWASGAARPHRVRVIAVHTTGDAEVTVVEQVVCGTVAATGEPFVFPGVLVLRARDGEIVHARDYMDGLAVAHAMGRLPAVTAALAVPRAR